jgi:hypothetical protein
MNGRQPGKHAIGRVVAGTAGALDRKIHSPFAPATPVSIGSDFLLVLTP